MFPSPEGLDRAIRLIELRNIIVHNRGVVSNVFKQRLPEYPLEVGERVEFDFQEILREGIFLAKSVDLIDKISVAKFGLPIVKSLTFPAENE